MKVESRDKTVKELLHESYYRIPRYQREYGWTRANVEDLWNDAIQDFPNNYFIGAMTVYPSPDDVRDVVDGQQRLTTITILLAAIRDALREHGHLALAEGLHQFIERKVVDAKLRYVLMTETSRPFLQEHIQKWDEPDAVETSGDEEEKRLRDVSAYFRAQLEDSIGPYKADPTLSDEKRLEAIKDQLVRIRDQVLGLLVIRVHVDNEDDAYVIFETLNSRGKDLTVADLTKSWILKGLKPKSKGIDTPRDRWRSIQDLFAQSDANISINRFLHHSWLARHSYVSEKALFPEVRKATKAQTDRESLLNELVADSKVYRAMHEPDSFKWEKENRRQLVPSIQALIDINVRQPHPYVLAVLRARQDGHISLKLARAALESVEKFHFMFTAVANKSSSGGISKMYASHARTLLSAKTADQRAATIRELQVKLRQRIPTRDEFIEGFIELRFSQQMKSQRKVVQYALRRHYAHHATGTPDFNEMNIEHIAPERPKNGRPVKDFDAIGNLLFVDEKLNTSLGNRSFRDKLPLLQKASNGQVWIDPTVISQATWTSDRINKRSRIMAEEGYDTIWKF